MSDDGADLNMPADGAMKAVLGGEQPERLDDAAFAQKIRTAERVHSYDGCATRCARLVLEYLESHPEAHAKDANGDLYDLVKASVSPEDRKEVMGELTGFMWGWAVNAARHVLKLKPVPNPAIITIG